MYVRVHLCVCVCVCVCVCARARALVCVCFRALHISIFLSNRIFEHFRIQTNLEYLEENE